MSLANNSIIEIVQKRLKWLILRGDIEAKGIACSFNKIFTQMLSLKDGKFGLDNVILICYKNQKERYPDTVLRVGG